MPEGENETMSKKPALKITNALDGSFETRRWDASIFDEAPVKVFHLAAKAFDFRDVCSMCMTYVDPEGDSVVISHGLVQYEMPEAVRCSTGGTLALTVHASKGAAKEYLQKKSLGPRPGMCVALDLGVPLREARELVRRAARGDEIARRVVAPSKDFYARLPNKEIFFDDDAFQAALHAKQPLDEKAIHYGVTCDVTGMNPIVGTRWHLVGANYDLCDDAYNHLSDADKSKYVAIQTPSRRGMRFCMRGKFPRGPHHHHHQRRPTPQQNGAAASEPPPPPPPPKAQAQEEEQEQVRFPFPKAEVPEQTSQPTDLLLGENAPGEEDLALFQPPPPYEPPAIDSDDDLVVVDNGLSDAIQLLTDMGFEDKEHAATTLLRAGSVEKAVEDLIQHNNA